MKAVNEALAKVCFLVDPETLHTETLWARPIETGVFELLNVPFHAYGCAIGDLVRCDDAQHPVRFLEVVSASGNLTARVVASATRRQARKTAILDGLDALGCSYEVLSHDSGLIAVSIPAGLAPEPVVTYFEELRNRGDAEWEAGNFSVEW